MGTSGKGCFHRHTIKRRKLQQQEVSWQRPSFLLTRPFCKVWCWGESLGELHAGDSGVTSGKGEECFQWLSPCFGEGGTGHCDDQKQLYISCLVATFSGKTVLAANKHFMFVNCFFGCSKLPSKSSDSWSSTPPAVSAGGQDTPWISLLPVQHQHFPSFAAVAQSSSTRVPQAVAHGRGSAAPAREKGPAPPLGIPAQQESPLGLMCSEDTSLMNLQPLINVGAPLC